MVELWEGGGAYVDCFGIVGEAVEEDVSVDLHSL